MPVLKVKKNGVWEYVGGVAGGSNLPDYAEEDYGKVLSPSAEGLTWIEQTGGNGIIVQPEQPTDVEDGTLWIDTDEVDEGGSGSGESEYFTVTWDFSAEASHSYSEIEAAINEGKRPRLVMAGMEHLEPLYFEGSENGISRFSGVSYASDSKTVLITAIQIDDEKKVTFTQEEGKLVHTPTEADYGKVLSATADGLVWVAQSGSGGSSSPSVEGVEF